MTPAELMLIVYTGRSSTTALASTLRLEARKTFYDKCTVIQRSYTVRCGSGVPCLPGGCSMDAGEICLEALTNAEPEYSMRVFEAWRAIFDHSENRTDEWKD